jgi:hypothetical protein
MPVILPRVTGYDDGRVACTEDELIIRHYYVSGAKHIGYPEIHEAGQVPLGSLGRWRIHGSGDLVHWFNFDLGRPHKSTALVIYTDARIRPVITPDDPAQVAAELARRGVNVTTGHEDGLV